MAEANATDGTMIGTISL